MAIPSLKSTSRAANAYLVSHDAKVADLAAKTSEVIGSFKNEGMETRYCGPSAAFHFLSLSDAPVKAEEVVKKFHIPTVNQLGTNTRMVKSAMESLSNLQLRAKKTLQSTEVEQILLKGSPITALVRGQPESHWVNIIGFDSDYFYVLDYDEILKIPKSELSQRGISYLFRNTERET